MWIDIILLVAGLSIMAFGLFLLFKEGFVEKLRKGIWKPTGTSSEEGSYFYDRYARGIKFFILGLLVVIFTILSFI